MGVTIMSVYKVFFSPTGTTKKVVNQIGKHFNDIKTIDLTLPKQRNRILDLNQEDILIIGLPVYAGRLPELIMDQLEHIKGQKTPAIIAVVYGNRDYDDALLELKDLMLKQGFLPIAAGAFIGQHSYTELVGTHRPDAEDLLIIDEFTEKVFNKMPSSQIVEVKGNKPYRDGMKKGGFGPIVKDSCIKCRMCEIACPTGAISFKGQIVVEDDLCIRCHACVRKCPIYAIEFDERINPAKEWLETNFSKRRKVEIFI